MDVRQLAAVSVLAVLAALAVAATDYDSAQKKIDRLTSSKLKPGTRIELTPQELTAYAAHEAPAGVRNLKLQLKTSQQATGTALVDFGRVGRAQGWQPNRLLAILLDGERPVSVTVKLQSAGGQAAVFVQSVTISGLTLDGATLDFLIKNLLLRLYPSAAVGRPFDLGYNIDRIEVQPKGVSIVIGR